MLIPLIQTDRDIRDVALSGLTEQLPSRKGSQLGHGPGTVAAAI